MATQSSVLAWRIPGTREPGGLLSLGSHRVGHDWSDLAAAAAAAWCYKGRTIMISAGIKKRKGIRSGHGPGCDDKWLWRRVKNGGATVPNLFFPSFLVIKSPSFSWTHHHAEERLHLPASLTAWHGHVKWYICMQTLAPAFREGKCISPYPLAGMW